MSFVRVYYLGWRTFVNTLGSEISILEGSNKFQYWKWVEIRVCSLWVFKLISTFYYILWGENKILSSILSRSDVLNYTFNL